jgi:hypothetical protein
MLPKRKRLGRVDGVEIFRVDGHRIRDLVDVEFTNGHTHLTRRYVPAGEIWLDREAPGSGEWTFWAAHQVAELRAMERGVPYLEALRAGNRAERAARRAAGLPGPSDRPRVRPKLRRRQLRRVAGKTVWLVDGRLVRSAFDLNFTLGGHHRRYRFIPRHEVWIDDAVSAAERPAILHHELIEIVAMERGLSYDDGHALASRAERRFRAEARRGVM